MRVRVRVEGEGKGLWLDLDLGLGLGLGLGSRSRLGLVGAPSRLSMPMAGSKSELRHRMACSVHGMGSTVSPG